MTIQCRNLEVIVHVSHNETIHVGKNLVLPNLQSLYCKKKSDYIPIFQPTPACTMVKIWHHKFESNHPKSTVSEEIAMYRVWQYYHPRSPEISHEIPLKSHQIPRNASSKLYPSSNHPAFCPGARQNLRSPESSANKNGDLNSKLSC